MQEQKDKISLDDKIINWVSLNLSYSFLILLLIIFIVLLSVFGITALIYQDKTILNPNEIGDAIGGMTAPIIGLFSAFLVYIAFRSQIDANIKLEVFNKKQIQITEFQNLKLITDHIHFIANNIKIKQQGSSELENIGFENCEKRIFQLSTKINFILSFDIEKNIDISQFWQLENYLNILLSKLDKSELDDLDKDFLLTGISKYHVDRYRYFNLNEYKEDIDTKEILKPHKDILLRRANYLNEIIKCLDNFHKY